ncbi:MAG: DUF924 family protein [Waddliaceae bacterium]
MAARKTLPLLLALFMVTHTNGAANTDNTMAQEILTYWFGTLTDPADDSPKEKRDAWFAGGPRVDKEIKTRFEPLVQRAGAQELEGWSTTARGRLALIILLDQFPRNIYRGTPHAFAFDSLSLKLAKEGIELGQDRLLFPVERMFFYLPFMHAEDKELQEFSAALYEELLHEAPKGLKERFARSVHYADRHREIIDRFGRFPHRNAILRRESTPEELDFLTQPGSSF